MGKNRGGSAMTWGIPTASFVQIHVLISLIGIASGFAVAYGLLTNRLFFGWTALFLTTTILTSITGFPIPPFGFDPPRAIGVISLILLAGAVVSFYIFHVVGVWRWAYIGCAITAFYLNTFVAVVQAFQKLPVLHPLAPTQSEPPFLIAQIGVLIIFVVMGVLAVIRFHPEIKTEN
jgi:hypothetical protein